MRRIVYLGGLVPDDAPLSRHLASRLAVEQALLEAVPEPIALRASIVIGARSRSFRFLVRLIERLPVLALPGLAREPHARRSTAATCSSSWPAPRPRRPRSPGASWDIGGPDVMTYAEHDRPHRRRACWSAGPRSRSTST